MIDITVIEMPDIVRAAYSADANSRDSEHSLSIETMHSSLLRARSAASDTAKVPIPPSQRSAVQVLFESLQGPYWEYKNTARLGREWDVYNSSSDPCIDEWYGVGCSCNGKESHYRFDDDAPQYHYYEWYFDDDKNTYPRACNITHIVLHSINLSGQIPESIGSISTLQQLLLSGEQLYGELPASIGNLTDLEYLAVIQTSVSGAVPESIGRLVRLKYLSLYASQFTSLPESIGDLVNLHETWLAVNQFSQLPDSIGGLANLQKLSLSSNQLTEVPDSIGGLANLQYLYLFYNQLTEVPDSIGGLANLQYLYLYGNQLTEVPECIGNLTALVDLELDDNLITELPDSLFSRLSNLTTLWLAFNPMTSLPNSIGDLQKLEYLYLQFMQLSALPASLGQLSNLKTVFVKSNYLREFVFELPLLQVLVLSDNKLSSPPSSKWENLSYFDVSNNNISSDLDFIVGMTNIRGLFLQNNAMTGAIPDELYDFSGLEYFSAASNKLSGSINHRFSTAFAKLVSWDVSNNQLSGALPSLPSSFVASTQIIKFAGNKFTGSGLLFNCSSSATKLLSLDLHDNLLSGEVGSSVFDCMSLEYINLSGNRLSGPLPNSFSRLPSLRGLYLSGNSFSSSLPSSLSTLYALEELWLHDNDFRGSVPSLQKLHSLNQLFLQNNQFSGELTFMSATNNSLLRVVDLSNNLFEGYVDMDLLSLDSLNSFAASSNCLRVEFTDAVCKGSSLETLILDGIFTSESCRNNLMLHVTDQTYASQQSVSGLPTCLFNISSLRILHLSGNGITGYLPSAVVLGERLKELILSHNQFRNAIPTSVQRHRWRVLDLSYNRFSGALLPDLNVSESISLDVNRLSGGIPPSLYSTPSVSVLNGNMFDCDSGDVARMKSDPSSGKYSCGSDSMNSAMTGWAVVLVLACVLPHVARVGLSVSERGRQWAVALRQSSVYAATLLSNAVQIEAMKEAALDRSGDIDTSNIADFVTFLVSLRKACAVACAVVVAVYMPVYLSLSAYYRQYEDSYIYFCSIAYMSGATPGIVLFVFLTVGLVLIRLKMLMFYRRKSAKESNGDVIGAEGRATYNAVLIFLATANIVLVSLVNVGYVYYSQVSSAQTTLVVAMALFKIFWTTFVMPRSFEQMLQMYMTKYSEKMRIDSAGESIKKKILLLHELLARKNAMFVSLVSILNNVVIPCFVVIFQSSKCLYETVSTSGDVSSSYAATYYTVDLGMEALVDIYTGTNEVVFFPISSPDFVSVTTTYQPPFSYSYECSSTMLVSFAQVFLYQCIFITFVKPVIQYVLVNMYRRKYTRLYSILSKADLLPTLVLTVLDDEENRRAPPELNGLEGEGGEAVKANPHQAVFRTRAFLSEIFTLVALLISFGVALPPLAVALTVAIVSSSYKTQLELGYFLSKACEHKADERIRQLNSDLKTVMGSFFSSLKMAYAFTTMFLASFLMDIVGDEAGYEIGLVPAILFIAVSAAIYFAVSVSARYAQGGMKLQRRESDLNVELSIYKKRKETKITYVDNPMMASKVDRDASFHM